MEKKFSRAEVHRHQSLDSCWVIHSGKVYDISKFVRMHPGGEQMILKRAGRDVEEAMADTPHRHSLNAYRWLQQHYIGDLATEGGGETAQPDLFRQQGDSLAQRKSTERDREVKGHLDPRCKPVDLENDLVDWGKPLLWQVGHLKERYDEWVHQPIDRPIRLFYSNFIEAITKTAWYVVPLVWVPVILYLCWHCVSLLSHGDTHLFSSLSPDYSIPVSTSVFPYLFLTGVFLWSLIEYAIHRFVFHMTPPANNYYLITLHFLLHGQHHKSPFDGSRLVFPPIPASLIVGLFYATFKVILPEAVGLSLFVGGLCGYVLYDLMHYYLHHGSPGKGSYLYGLKVYHVKHHFEHQRAGKEGLRLMCGYVQGSYGH
uniref:Fatty acid 2-hydroxylase n=1 Tax=Latimeria chalumnae TaxID=7897 RepID=H3AAQ6_LATCH